jgi:hypothetical protein
MLNVVITEGQQGERCVGIGLESSDRVVINGLAVPGVALSVKRARNTAQEILTVAKQISAPNRNKLSEVEFEQATKTVAFEMYNFRCLARIYRDGHKGAGLWKLMLSQTLLIHLRILIEFFYWDCRNSRDITIETFIARDDFSFPRELFSAPLKIKLQGDTSDGPREMTLKQVKEALDQRLVHFGAGRWTGYHPGHEDYELCFNDLETRIVAFRSALPRHLRQLFDLRVGEFADREKSIALPIREGPVLSW